MPSDLPGARHRPDHPNMALGGVMSKVRPSVRRKTVACNISHNQSRGSTGRHRLEPRPGQNTSSQGVPAISAARIVGDHSMSLLATSCSFQRAMTAFASARGRIGSLPLRAYGNVQAPRPHAHRGNIAESVRLIKWRNA
jgi:hypothetical protein